MPNDTDILLRLLLEDKLTGDLDKTMSSIEARMKKASSVKEVDALEKEWKQVTDQINEATRAAEAQSAVYRAQASLLANQVTQMRARSAEMARLSGVVGNASRTAGVAGGLILGGAFAEVNRYVANAKEATAVTRAWAAEQEKLASARARVDEVLAQEALPMLRMAARFANEAASFIEKHPEIVDATLKAGAILVGIGTIGSLVARGIKMKADALYLASVPVQMQAAQLQALAAANQLAAAKMQAGLEGISAPAAGGTAAGSRGVGWLIGPASLIVTGLLATAAVSAWVDQIMEKSGFGDKRRSALQTARDNNQKIYPGNIFNPQERQLQIQLNRAIDQGNTAEIDRLKQEIADLGKQAGDTADDLAKATDQLAGSANEAAVVDIFTQWREDDARLVREAAENRKKIIAETEQQIADITRRYAQQRTNINTQFNQNRTDIISSFNEASQQAEIDYANRRAEIIRDAGEDIQRIEEQHQENIRKMTLEHMDRVDELTAARDALGLVKEQRKFDRDVAEAERETNREIAMRKRETAQRLQELAVQYAQERAQRQAEFIQNLAENEQRRQEELKQAALAQQEELKQAREASAQKLRELQESLNAERLRRREVMIAEIRDLDAGLLGERNLKQGYYNLMLADAEAWLAAYRAKLASLSTITATAKADGGYASYGLYRLGDNASGGPGGTEFVMNASTTRAAERLIGGQLTQRALLAAMMGGGGKQITWNDHRRFDGRVTMAERRAITEDTKAVIYQELGLL